MIGNLTLALILRVFFTLKVIGNLKTVIIMAKVDLTFLDLYDGTKLEVQEFDGIINVRVYNNDYDIWIDLDKSTAIKFAKTLRTEINKINS